MKASLKKIGLSLFVAAATILWSTCEVGLGEAVDTLAPTVSVTSPAASAVCKGVVNIAGGCMDDKAVARVDVVVTNTGTGKKYNYSAKLKDLTSWTLKVNELVAGSGYPLPDGSYTADVTAMDIYGRLSGTSSTAFDIDNTPPVFCVTSPASLDILNPKQYGRSVTISGEIADDHDIANMKIRVFRTDKDGNNTVEITGELAKTEFKDFETAGGTTVYVAKYFDAEPPSVNPDGSENNDWFLYKNYMAMYGNTALGNDVYIYVVPSLTDIAGNTSNVCYLSSVMKNLAASLCGVDITCDSLQTAQLMKILNGTYSLGEFNDEQKAKILSLLNGSYQLQPGDAAYYSQYNDEDAAKQSPLAACVNSNNAPTYDFNGYENPNTKGWVGVGTGGTITITLAAGRDGWGILPGSLVVNVYSYNKTTEEKGALAFSSDKDRDPKKTATILIKDATNNIINDPDKKIETSVINQSYYVTLPELAAGNYYLIEAEGKDENGSALAPLASNVYGFRVASNITPPTVTASDLFYIKGADILGDGLNDSVYKFKLNIRDVSGGIRTNGVEVWADIYHKHISKGSVNQYTADATKQSTTTKYTAAIQPRKDSQGADVPNEYYLELPIKDFAFTSADVATNANYTIVLRAAAHYVDADGNDAHSDWKFLFWVDNAAPEIKIDSPTNNELVTQKYRSYNPNNSSIRPKGNWNDKDSSASLTGEEGFGSGTYRLWYTTSDSASAPSVVWNQAAIFVAGTKYYERHSNDDGSKLCYVYSDISKFAEGVTYYTLNLDPAYAADWKEVASVSQSASPTSWEQEIVVAEGTGKFFRVFGVDAVGNVSAVTQVTGLTYDFKIPEIKLTAEPATTTSELDKDEKRYYYNQASLSARNTLVFTATDSSAIAASGVTVTAKKDGATVASGTNGYTCTIAQTPITVSGNPATDPKSVTVTITLDTAQAIDGKWEFALTATNGAGQEGKALSVTRIVDTTAPAFDGSIKVVSGSGESAWSADAWYASLGPSFKGNIIEATSGLAKIESTLTPTKSDAKKTAKDYSGEKGTTLAPFNFTIAPAGFKQSDSVRDGSGNFATNSLVIAAYDKAGNSSKVELPKINIDQSQPVFKALYYTYKASPEATDLVALEGAVMSDGNKALTVYGTISCPLSGLNDMTWKINRVDVTSDISIEYTTIDLPNAAAYVSDSANWGAMPADSYKVTGWKVKIPKEKLAAGGVNIAASNKAGNNHEESGVFTIQIDKDSPEIMLNDPDTSIIGYKAIKNGGEDTTKPTKKYDGSTVPVNALSVNGAQKISGSAQDNNQIDSVNVYYSTNSDASIDTSGSTPRDKVVASSGKDSWGTSAAYEFNKIVVEGGKYLYKFADGADYNGSPKTLYIKVQAKDKAMNETVIVYEYSVDPGSDRPRISFDKSFDSLNGMTSVNHLKKEGKSLVKGEIQDDDGLTGLELKYKEKKDDADWTAWTPVALNPSSDGSKATFELYVDDASNPGQYDGRHEILFQIKDAAGTVFETGPGSDTAAAWVRPRIYKDKDNGYFGDNNTDDTSLYIDIDTQAPKIENPKFDFDGSGTDKISDLGIVGGTKNKFYIYFDASDSSGLDLTKAKFTLNGKDSDGNNFTDAYALKSNYDSATKKYSFYIDSSAHSGGISVAKNGKKFDTETDGVDQKNYTGTITVVDNFGNSSSHDLQITVDNTSPTINSYAPSETQAVCGGGIKAEGTVKGAKALTSGVGAKFGGLKFALTDSATTPADSAFMPIAQKDGEETSWDLYFDSQNTSAGYDIVNGETHPLAIKEFIIYKHIAGIQNETDFENYKNIIELYLHIRGEDDVGNVKNEKFKILYDPQGTRPTISFAYPENNSEKIGGEVKFYGGAVAKDPNNPAITAVYAQIGFVDAAATTFTPTAADWNAIKDHYTIVSMKDGKSWGASGSSTDPTEYGIKATVTGSSWSIKVNADNNLYNASKKVAIKVYATDGVNVSEPETRFFTVDNDSPVMANVYLKQFNGSGTVTANKEYKDGMYVKDNWHLTFEVSDSSDKIKYIKINGADKLDDPDVCTKSADEKTVTVKYSLGTGSGVGTKDITVEFEDSATRDRPLIVKKNFKINYDNTPPVLLKSGQPGYGINDKIQQSNGWYQLSSKVSEQDVGATKQSGFERVAFYFTRGSDIFDPMFSKKATGNRFPTTGLKKEDGLYWKQVTVARDADNLNALTISGSVDTFIHVGGLVKLGGSIYRIEEAVGASITIDGQPAYSTATENALFAVANVVDNLKLEKAAGSRSAAAGYGYGYYPAPTNDDGDKMIESITKSLTEAETWTWTASIYSKNIPDGDVQIHYVAFDKAGNYAQAGGSGESTDKTVFDPPVVAAKVCNNIPRLANFYVGTDLNADNVVGDPAHPDVYESLTGEWAAPLAAEDLTWNQDYNSGTAKTSVELGSATDAYLTAKGKTVVRPEILGGNGKLYYAYKITGKDGSGTAFTISGNKNAAFITDPLEELIETDKSKSDTVKRTNDITIQVGDFTSDTLRTGGIPDCAATSPHKFEFTFYDETEGAAAYGTTGFDTRESKAVAAIYMASEVNDSIDPLSSREEFFWNGRGPTDGEGKPNNSVVWKNNTTPEGHIELSGQLPAIFKTTGADYTPTDGSGITYPATLMDRDAKVSGKIVMRGNVSDNKMLYRIYMKIPQMETQFTAAGLEKDTSTGTSYKGFVVAEYDPSAKTWTTPAAAKLDDYGIQFTLKNNEITAEGHFVDWEFIWDTSFVDGVAAADVTVDIYSSDQGILSAPANDGTYISLNGTAKYKAPSFTENNISAPAAVKVDVVPYITGIVSQVLGKKSASYRRTAMGHWPVWLRTDSPDAAGDYATTNTKEEFTVEGFNFSQKSAPKTGVTQAASGPYTALVNTNIYSLNNINNNDAALKSDDYENAYNRQPNGKNNDLLTDDVYIDVWQLNGKAALPVTQKIEMPTMKINPNNDMIGFAFRSGTQKREFSMPDGKNNSYRHWHKAADIQNSVTLGYDSEGASYGTVAGGESGNNGADYTDFFSFNTSRWGYEDGSVAGEKRARIEMTGQKGTKANPNAAVETNLKTKHQSPSIATAGTNVYLAYYDSWNEEIRFRSSLKQAFEKENGKRKGNTGNFVDLNKEYNEVGTFTYSETTANCQIVAETVSPVAKPGQYVSIAAMPGAGTSDDAVVMVWYDGSKMWYSYNTTPNTNRGGTKNTQSEADADGWSKPVTIFDDHVGQYCKVAFDGKGGVHIAAYHDQKFDIWHAYIADYKTPSGAVKSRVDSDGTVGENLTLDVTVDSSGKAIPYIGYYATNMAKMARPAKAGVFGDGAELSGKFTQKWEVTYIPTTNTVQKDNINVGLWKSKVLANKTGGVWKASTPNNTKVYSATTDGVCYGNGSLNAVMGYRYVDPDDVSAGYIETAQLTGTPYGAY